MFIFNDQSAAVPKIVLPEVSYQPPLRILMISDHADPLAEVGSREAGGQNVYVFYLAKFLASLGVFVDVYTRWNRNNKKEIVNINHHFRVIRVKAGPKRYMMRDNFFNVLDEFTKNITKRISKEGLRYDLVHSNYVFSGICGLILSKTVGIPLVHTYHSIGLVRFNTLKHFKGQAADYEFFQKRIAAEQEIAQRATKVIATSPFEADTVKQLFGITSDKIVVITEGVDTKIFRKIRQDKVRERLQFDPNKKLILYVGRIEWRKGIGTLLYALKEIIKSHPDAHLHIIGGGRSQATQKLDEREMIRLHDIVSRLKLNDFVHFLGPKNQKVLYRYFNAADVCAVPSYYEPFGIVPLEAMACGTPVVASRTGGLQFTVQDGVTGYLVEPRDYHNLATKISLVLDKKKEYFSAHCIERIHKHFLWEDIVQEYITLFNQLANHT